jgi:hypothetical protein
VNINDDATLKGMFELRVYRDGALVEEYQDNNMILNAAKYALARLIAGAGSGKVITQIGFGVNGSGPSPDDTALTAAFTKTISGITYPAPGQVKFAWNLATTEANGMTIREFGLICSDATLFARKTRGAIEKAADISLDGSWTIIF